MSFSALDAMMNFKPVIERSLFDHFNINIDAFDNDSPNASDMSSVQIEAFQGMRDIEAAVLMSAAYGYPARRIHDPGEFFYYTVITKGIVRSRTLYVLQTHRPTEDHSPLVFLLKDESNVVHRLASLDSESRICIYVPALGELRVTAGFWNSSLGKCSPVTKALRKVVNVFAEMPSEISAVAQCTIFSSHPLLLDYQRALECLADPRG